MSNFPGDSDCYAGFVSDWSGARHVCGKCEGDGCKPKRIRRDVRERREELFRDLSGSTVFSDQRGNAVFVDQERGTAYVLELA